MGLLDGIAFRPLPIPWRPWTSVPRIFGVPARPWWPTGRLYINTDQVRREAAQLSGLGSAIDATGRNIGAIVDDLPRLAPVTGGALRLRGEDLGRRPRRLAERIEAHAVDAKHQADAVDLLERVAKAIGLGAVLRVLGTVVHGSTPDTPKGQRDSHTVPSPSKPAPSTAQPAQSNSGSKVGTLTPERPALGDDAFYLRQEVQDWLAKGDKSWLIGGSLDYHCTVWANVRLRQLFGERFTTPLRGNGGWVGVGDPRVESLSEPALGAIAQYDGHVMIVEGVERNATGEIISITMSDGNGSGTTQAEWDDGTKAEWGGARVYRPVGGQWKSSFHTRPIRFSMLKV